MNDALTKNRIKNLVLAAMFLAIALVLPFFTGQIPQIGRMLCPMHLPVFLCGFFCGPIYGLAIGLVAPILRFFIFGMPQLVPSGVAMSFELATYGLISGLLYIALPKKKLNIYFSLIIAMLAGRIVWAIVEMVLYGLGQTDFGLQIFITAAFVNAVPGIIIQLILIPILVMILKK